MHRWVDHTAELELQIETDNERAVFEEALMAFGELLVERTEEEGEPASHEVIASAPDRATLLAEWLSELVYLAETQGFMPQRAERLVLDETGIEATVRGRTARPPHLVKAVTYHRLGLWEEGGAWHARVVLDV